VVLLGLVEQLLVAQQRAGLRPQRLDGRRGGQLHERVGQQPEHIADLDQVRPRIRHGRSRIVQGLPGQRQ
jgi:hypothetical protein